MKLSFLHDTWGTFYKNVFSVSTSNILWMWLDDAAFPKKAVGIRHFPCPFQDGISSGHGQLCSGTNPACFVPDVTLTHLQWNSLPCTPLLKPIHHLSLQNRIRGFKKHRSFAFSIQFLKWFFFALMGGSTAATFPKALENTAPPQGMNNLPRAEQQNIACFRAGRGFELRCTEVKNKQWFFPLPFLYYKGFFSMMFLSQSQSWMA